MNNFRAIKCLLSLPENELFREVSIGIGHIVEVANRLDRSARRFPGAGKWYGKSIHRHAAELLGTVAAEEAAKAFILLDLVRCPPRRSAERSRVFGYFYNHLAKGIYAEYCAWRPANFAEVQRHIDREREAFYLDGPEGVEWIFYNDILSRREDAFYVNYVKADEGDCYWQYPRVADFLLGYHTAAAIRIACALHSVGLTSPEGLEVVAEIWRTVDITPDMTSGTLRKLNMTTLRVLEGKGILCDVSSEHYSCVSQEWPFPLYTLDLSLNPSDPGKRKQLIKDLRQRRERWWPEW